MPCNVFSDTFIWNSPSEKMFVFCLLLSVANAQLDVLQTIYGPVKGAVKDGIRYFKGVPFASPPIGKRRFRPPQPPAKWTAMRDATREGNICPQQMSFGPFVIGNEDCLYLDVYIPANATGPLPVMFWIYGGAWQIGDKYELGLYEATNSVKAVDHIHVAANYRLGVFGFMSLPELFAESGTTGNYALQDQLAALQFVRDNAAAIGADPSRVTIYGESAGGFSVCWHLVSPLSAKLFSSAIIESGNCEIHQLWAPRNQTDLYSQHYANSVGCSGASIVDCLRGLSTDDVFAGDLYGPGAILAPFMSWAAAIDFAPNGLSGVPGDLIRANKYHKCPVIIGNNNDEGSIIIPALPFVVGVVLPMTRAGFDDVVRHFWNNATLADLIITYYDHAPTFEDKFAEAFADWFFACPARTTARSLAPKSATFLYHYEYIARNWIDNRDLGDYHTAELFFVFGNPWPPLVHQFDARDRRFVDIIQNYWFSMAVASNPNSLNPKTVWPAYNDTLQNDLRLDEPSYVEQYYRANLCTSVWKYVK